MTIRDLLRNALRMRPDRIVIGEVRGAEALDLLTALNTGHDGALSTVHANSPAGRAEPTRDPRLDGRCGPAPRRSQSRLGGVIDLVVHLERREDGARVVDEIVEVVVSGGAGCGCRR